MWCVDNNKSSYLDSKVVDNLLEIIKTKFGEIKITRRKKHTVLGMIIRITEDKKIEIEME